jgi:hypothetical protein
LGFGIWDLGFGIWDLGSGIWDLGFGIWDFGIWDHQIHLSNFKFQFFFFSDKALPETVLSGKAYA